MFEDGKKECDIVKESTNRCYIRSSVCVKEKRCNGFTEIQINWDTSPVFKRLRSCERAIYNQVLYNTKLYSMITYEQNALMTPSNSVLHT